MSENFRRIAIANRGEPAMRLIHAVRELEGQERRGLTTIALYTDPDRKAMFVREADEAVSLGPATFVDERDGGRKNAYLNYPGLQRALSQAGAEAVWVGWGFVAEHAAFADLCRDLGVVFIGPSGDVMRRLGDKISSKRMAEKAKVPVAPWSGGPVETLGEARKHAKRLGYPLMIKATAGGGGRGIRKVRNKAELATAFERARSEALQAFGDATVFLERLVTGARHVEVQVIADRHGNAWGLGVRDCTIQRRNQKVLEETPSPALTAKQDKKLRAAAVRLCKKVGYHNAGTVEFLYHPESHTFSFMEVNARLQVEHPVTEMTTGADLVKLQIHVARGGKLADDPPASRGHAIEVRLNAEDPENAFAPAPGKIELLRLPTGPGLRVDTGVEEGDSVPSEFDSMIAKIISWGRDRDEALARLRRALASSTAILRGGATNKGFLLDLLSRPAVEKSELDVGWLDRRVAAGEHLSRQHAEIALLAAAVEAYDAEVAVERSRFYASALRGRPEVGDEVARTVELELYGRSYEPAVYRLGPRHYRIEIGDRWLDLWFERLGPRERSLEIDDRRYRVSSVTDGPHYLVEVDGVPHRISRDEGGVVRALSPAVVVAVAVAGGDRVEVGDRLVVLEAMKMETTVVAKFAGVVREVLVVDNVQVPPGAPLLRIEPEGGEARSAAVDEIRFDELPEVTLAVEPRELCRQCSAELRSLFQGYDIGPGHQRWLMEARDRICREMPGGDEDIRQREDRLLEIFVDICSLFEPQSDLDELGGDRRRSSGAYFRTYLRSLESGGEGLPESFAGLLGQALAHYGVEGLEHTRELEESLFRIYRSRRREEAMVAPVLNILERRIEAYEELAEHTGDDFRKLLERLVAVARGRFPAIHDGAREVRYHYFDRSVWQQARREVYDRCDGELAELARRPDPGRREELVRSLVACPQPLKSFISQRYKKAGRELRAAMLEVLTRRYYRIRDLGGFEVERSKGHTFLSADYPFLGKTVRVITTHCKYGKLHRAAAGLAPLVRAVPEDRDVVVDFYVWRGRALGDPEATRKKLLAIVNRAKFGRRVRRIVVAISGLGSGLGMSGVQHFTFRPGDLRPGTGAEDDFWEEKLYRGLHPMMGKRIHLWRLANFHIERLLPTDEDLYLFRGVARDNPRDERLFAVAEVRDLTPVRDAAGRVAELPDLERMYLAALAGIRRFQSRREPRARLHWNRLMLYVWPPLDLQGGEIDAIARRLAPEADGLGLERTVVWARVPQASGELRETAIYISTPDGRDPVVRYREPASEPMKTLDPYAQKVVRLRQRGLVYPYELLSTLTPGSAGGAGAIPAGEFVEYDLDADNRLVPVERAPGGNRANVVVGVVRNFTAKVPEGMTRVILLGDPSRGMGSLAEPECRRIVAALDLADEMGVPLEWFAVSAGAKIAMDSGVENMDWIARVLRRLVVFTQAGGEVNLVVNGVNVGAQPYWNAEATMLMHTRGILIMTPEGAMVLTGKQALDYSGGVSAEDNQGIGGYEHIMGPNGQAQYFARDVGEACRILLRHYEHTYVVSGERFPRRVATEDPAERDVTTSPHGRRDGTAFDLVGDVFAAAENPGRKKPFDIRRVMTAVIDRDHDPLERWYGMHDAEIAVVWDAHLGGHPVCLLGLESRPLPRLGFVPADGPDSWTAGTLFPQSSKKVARALNAASGNRPVVILANLSGFDGSPESMRSLQLEYGAEIGRAVVNFRGPMVFCVISRYHGGAFVVFSNALNENLEVAALEGSYASVIGGAPAAAVVFARDVRQRTRRDRRIEELEERIAGASGAEKVRLQARHREVWKAVHSEKLGEVADEFDRVHSIYRAQEVGSVHHILPAARLRPYLIEAVERGMRRVLGGEEPADAATAARS